MDDIAFSKAFAKELEAETTATRKCLERIPANLFEYKPHEKSMPLGYLALLVAEIPKWITVMINDSEIDFMTYPHFKATNTAELVTHFDENIADAKKALLSIKENALKDPFYLKRNGQVVFSASKREQIESTINHMVHHRGQLTVYMRLNDIAVPSIYGPSADERSF
ncbi:damage-inducible protein DinB [Terrimonas sp.]|uniref:DinB family protein n=1 Tax=Terrimonas sp. TaxID=1914338 RepID=UPI000D50BAD9|nr:DinB family protein [Terrimonas sp.]PVD53652.1 damage-inducible protein DinB [Terrimonas sp.]